MTTGISINCYPYKTSDGRELEVKVTSVDTFEDGRPDVVMSVQTGKQGDILTGISCWHGRKVIIEEVPK